MVLQVKGIAVAVGPYFSSPHSVLGKYKKRYLRSHFPEPKFDLYVFCFSTSNGDMIYRHMYIHDCVQSCHSDDLINLLLIWLFWLSWLLEASLQLELGCAGGFPTGNWWEGSRDLFTLRPYLDMAYNWDILCWKKYNFWTFTGNKSIPKLKDVFRWN